MKTKLLALLLALVMVVTMLASCDFGNTPDDPDDGDDCTSHVDKNGDSKCDNCGTPVAPKPPVGGGDGEDDEDIPNITWSDKAELIFQMTDNSNGDELSSGCRRFLSGELLEGTVAGFVEENAQDRNDDAYEYANVHITYLYYPNSQGNGWGGNITNMFNAATSTTEKGRPDMFCNFVYDMVSSSLLGSFANLYTDKAASTGVKDGELRNYFAFAKNGKYDTTCVDTGEGYMIEYMQSLTLSETKMYLLASDYFTDLVRAFFAVPVNIGFLETAVTPSTTEGDFNYDYDGDGQYEIEDFYDLVRAGKWNYDAVMGFSDMVDSAPTDTTDVLADGKYGFAVAAGGLGASGLLYTTSIIVINRDVELKTDYTDVDNPVQYQDYTFWYPDDSETLAVFVENLNELFTAPGVVAVNTDAKRGAVNCRASDAELAVRSAFTNGQVLFGGIIAVGSLEESAYGDMTDNGGQGFGVVPVPLYRASYIDPTTGETKVDKYLTQIHNIGRVGAIGVKTKYFAQCSAFLNYQSLNSTDILNDYYNMTLKTDVAGDVQGNAEMLDYIRENVRSSFDKAFEDAVARHNFQSGDSELNDVKWHNMILGNLFQMTRDQMVSEYDRVRSMKVSALEALERSYINLPG